MGDEEQEQGQVQAATGSADAKWGDDISEARQQELAAVAAQQRAWAASSAEDRGDSPMYGAGPLTGAEVGWLAALALARDGQQEELVNDAARVAAAQSRLRAAATPAGAIAGSLLNLSALHLETLYVNPPAQQDLAAGSVGQTSPRYRRHLLYLGPAPLGQRSSLTELARY
jgi:hypothetical protein